jgi:hypothetical protein
VKPDPNRTIIATGHQPELFHPGVWFKNFLTDAVASKLNAVAANMVVDNDLARSSSIRIPGKVNGSSQIREAHFDAPLAETTWENRCVVDAAVFRAFVAEAREMFRPMMQSPDYEAGMLLDRLWPLAVSSLDRQNKEFIDLYTALSQVVDDPAPTACSPFGMLATCFTEARSQVEKELGLNIFNTPLSELTEHRPFLEFTRILLSRCQELHSIHNTALAEYRAANLIRSSTHPVPELSAEGEWLEAPFWISTFENLRRRRAFVRSARNGIQLSDRGQTLVTIPSGDSSDYWQILATNQVKLRPRALITTMYARLILSDLFIHGIGGAKYDELTDAIIRRFFGIEPPAYVTATATFRLPIDRPNVSYEDVRTSAQRIRELRYRPESFRRDPLARGDAHLAPRLSALAAEKRDFLDRHDLRRCSKQVFDQLDSLNRAMHELLKPVEEVLRAGHVELVAQAKQTQLLSSREFSFVLFPAEILPARLLALSQASP